VSIIQGCDFINYLKVERTITQQKLIIGVILKLFDCIHYNIIFEIQSAEVNHISKQI